MKYITLSIFLAFFILSSGFALPNKFTIKGTVKSQKSDLILIFKKYNINQNVQTALDTIILNKNGSFNKNLNFEPGIYQLEFKGLSKINIAVESGQTIEVLIDQKKIPILLQR
jgi:hypothetical protein